MTEFIIPEGFYPIKGFEKYYAISKKGEVMRIFKSKGATQGKILKTQIHSKRGYPIIRLTTKELARSYDIHILMANTFLGRTNSLLEVCHNNGIKTDCRLENLRLDTASSNQMDRVLHGTSNRGEQCGQNKYKTELILKIRNELDLFTPKEVSKKYGISYPYIIKIKNKEKWSWL